MCHYGHVADKMSPKQQLVQEAHKLGLGPSRAALDVYTRGELQQMIADAKK